MTDKPNPAKMSGDVAAMEKDWLNVETLFAGIDKLKERKGEYLPKFPDETDDVWKFRVSLAKFTNIFRDIVENLAARPFASEVTVLDESSTAAIDEFVDDVDAQGNSMHVFAEQCFFNAIGYGLDWIVVDYTDDGPEAGSVADEKIAGVRPFWRRYSAPNCIAVYSAIIDGEEQFVHARFKETHTERVGFDEESRERVRVWNREQLGTGMWANPTVEVWEKQVTEKNREPEWVIIKPAAPITIDRIPIVPVLTGRRRGSSWQLHLPMKDAADLQRTHFRQESALEYAKTMSAFPILTGNGIAPETDADGKAKKLTIGPQTVLYAPTPPGGGNPNWQIIEPSAESLRFLADDVKNTATELRELGRQPLTSAMGNLTVITSAVAGQKGAAAIQSWAIGLQNALEKALWLTNLWLKDTKADVKVAVNTDFDLTWTDDDGFDHVLKMRETGDISREAMVHEAKRRSILDKDYDAEQDLEAILKDLEDLPDNEDDEENEDEPELEVDGGD